MPRYTWSLPHVLQRTRATFGPHHRQDGVRQLHLAARARGIDLAAHPMRRHVVSSSLSGPGWPRRPRAGWPRRCRAPRGPRGRVASGASRHPPGRTRPVPIRPTRAEIDLGRPGPQPRHAPRRRPRGRRAGGGQGRRLRPRGGARRARARGGRRPLPRGGAGGGGACAPRGRAPERHPGARGRLRRRVGADAGAPDDPGGLPLRAPHRARGGGPCPGHDGPRPPQGRHRDGADSASSPPTLPAFLEAARACQRVELEGLCSHFANADLADAALTALQIARFRTALGQMRAAGFEPRWRHLSNSAGLLALPEARDGVEMNLARPGLGALRAGPGPLAPAAPDARAGAELEDGGGPREVGAGGDAHLLRQHLDRPAALAHRHACRWGTPTAGRVCSPTGGPSWSGGSRAPIVGRVCMDLCMVDVTDIPGAEVGDEVVLIGRQGSGGPGRPPARRAAGDHRLRRPVRHRRAGPPCREGRRALGCPAPPDDHLRPRVRRPGGTRSSAWSRASGAPSWASSRPSAGWPRSAVVGGGLDGAPALPAAERLRPVRLRGGGVHRPGGADRHLLRDGVRHPVLERLRAVRRREPGRPDRGPHRHPRAGAGVQRPDGDHAGLLGHVHRARHDAGHRAGGRAGDHGGQPGAVPPGPPGAGRACAWCRCSP